MLQNLRERIQVLFLKVGQAPRWVQIIGIIVLLLAAWFFIRWSNRDIINVKTAVVAKAAIEEVISVSGNVNAPVYELDSKIGGKIATLNAKEGQHVSKGQVLAELDNTIRLVAPESGIVAKINYLEGESVPVGQPAIIIVNYAKTWVEAQIDEIDIAAVEIGDKVKVTSDVYPDRVFTGEVFWITPLAELRKVGGRIKMDEESYVFPCKIKFTAKHDEMKVNMSVNVDIEGNKSVDALIIPREALISRDDTPYVYAIKKSRAHETKITTGIRSYSSIEVTAGLSEGDIVAVSSLAKLKNKGRVKIER